MTYYRVFLLLYLLPLLSFSQESKECLKFVEEVQTNTTELTKNESFKRVQTFFIEKQWDSTLVYTSQLLNQAELNQEMKDFTSYLRGYSFQRKQLFDEALKAYSNVSSEFKMIHQLNMNRGEIALEKSQFKKALNYFLVLDSVNTKKNIGIEKGSIKNNIGLCYMHSREYLKAESYLLESVQIQELEKNNVTKLVSSYGNLANAYYEQYKDDQAIRYFLKAYQLAKTSNDFFRKSDKFLFRQNTAKNMSVVEENRKDFQKALFYRKEAQEWKDSLNDQNRIYETAQLEKKIAVEQKEKEVQVL